MNRRVARCAFEVTSWKQITCVRNTGLLLPVALLRREQQRNKEQQAVVAPSNSTASTVYIESATRNTPIEKRRTAVIYFIQDSVNLAIKIGHTAASAGSRMAQLQTGNPSPLVLLGVMPGELVDERNLHVRFSAYRVAGEWFKPAPAVIRLILQAGGQGCPFVPAADLLAQLATAGYTLTPDRPSPGKLHVSPKPTPEWRAVIIERKQDLMQALLSGDEAVIRERANVIPEAAS